MKLSSFIQIVSKWQLRDLSCHRPMASLIKDEVKVLTPNVLFVYSFASFKMQSK